MKDRKSLYDITAGIPCVSIGGNELVGGVEVTVVRPQLPQKVFAARVEARVPECEALARADPPGTHYRVNWKGHPPKAPSSVSLSSEALGFERVRVWSPRAEQAGSPCSGS